MINPVTCEKLIERPIDQVFAMQHAKVLVRHTLAACPRADMSDDHSCLLLAATDVADATSAVNAGCEAGLRQIAIKRSQTMPRAAARPLAGRCFEVIYQALPIRKQI